VWSAVAALAGSSVAPDRVDARDKKAPNGPSVWAVLAVQFGLALGHPQILLKWSLDLIWPSSKPVIASAKRRNPV